MKQRPPRKTHWREKLRPKMGRWVQDCTPGHRLAALGVPLNLMRPEQRESALDAFRVGGPGLRPARLEGPTLVRRESP